MFILPFFAIFDLLFVLIRPSRRDMASWHCVYVSCFAVDVDGMSPFVQKAQLGGDSTEDGNEVPNQRTAVLCVTEGRAAQPAEKDRAGRFKKFPPYIACRDLAAVEIYPGIIGKQRQTFCSECRSLSVYCLSRRRKI